MSSLDNCVDQRTMQRQAKSIQTDLTLCDSLSVDNSNQMTNQSGREVAKENLRFFPHHKNRAMRVA